MPTMEIGPTASDISVQAADAVELLTVNAATASNIGVAGITATTPMLAFGETARAIGVQGIAAAEFLSTVAAPTASSISVAGINAEELTTAPLQVTMEAGQLMWFSPVYSAAKRILFVPPTIASVGDVWGVSLDADALAGQELKFTANGYAANENLDSYQLRYRDDTIVFYYNGDGRIKVLHFEPKRYRFTMDNPPTESTNINYTTATTDQKLDWLISKALYEG